MRGLALTVAAACAAAAIIIGKAGAEILISGPATKICVGYEGGGITWDIFLNHGWRPSPKLRYRVTLINPRGVRVGFSIGTWGGYFDSGRIDRENVWTNSYTPKRTGVFTFILETRIDPGYPDAPPGEELGVWERRRPVKIRVFACRGSP
jgi:hypothetical protein